MTDNRIVQNPTVNPFDSVVAVDATFSNTNFNGVGSGIVIGPSHILTAGHVVFNNTSVAQNARALLSTDVQNLMVPRIIYTTNAAGVVTSVNTPAPPPTSINVTSQPFFPLNYPANTNDFGSDIALLSTQSPLTTEANSLGLVVFLNPDDIVGAPITTAGYPATFSDGTQDSRTDDNTGRTLYSASGSVHSTTGGGLFGTDTRITYSDRSIRANAYSSQ
ncbi:MAG: hypothetical protein HC810_05685 [Acaryochloridaceae cyanobacterium RL_2_7]|nr:hypothetical protein [Acaryochloridaceae cyanobacterium RL_2_7]